MKTLKLFSILILGFAIISCSKDDDDDDDKDNIIVVEEIEGLTYSQDDDGGRIEIEWDTFEGADEYVIYFNGEEYNSYGAEIDLIHYSGLEDGDVIRVEAYSDSDLIAYSEIYFYSEAGDDNPDNNDNSDNDEVGEISGIEITEMHGSYTLLWDSYSGTIEYYVYLNGTKISDIPYTGTQAHFSELSAGDVIEIKAYSDSDQEELIASGSYTYGNNSDEGNDSNAFDLYDLSYFDTIEYLREDESYHDGNIKYKVWKLTSSTHSNLYMTISVTSSNSNGTQVKDATYNLGTSSGYASGGATAVIYDSSEENGWMLKSLTNGTMKVEGSTSSGCTITFISASDSNYEYSFNGTSTVMF